MTELDDDGMATLMRRAIVQAERDANRGDPEAKIFLQYMRGETMNNDWEERQLAQVDTTGPKRTALAAEASSPFETMSPEKLDALGVSPQWAGKTTADMAEMERQQAHRARADRLGVDWRYLPQLED